MPRWYLVLCHILVPVIFLGAARLHYQDRLLLRWEFVVVLTVAALPFLLPLFARYIKGIGKDGIQFHPFFGGQIFTASQNPSMQFTPDPISRPSPLPNTESKKFREYSRTARKALRTLWKFQNDNFGNDFSKRWGFGIHPLASDYHAFEAASAELRKDQLIQDDPRGMIYLTDKGIMFCRDSKNALDGGGDTWTTFSAG